MIADFHMHSNTSADSKQTVEDIYQSAKKKGLKYICITNHHEMYEAVRNDFHQSITKEDLNRLKKEISSIPKDWPRVYFGMEMSYTDDEEEAIKKFIEENDLDFVLGSAHLVYGLKVAAYKYRERVAKERTEDEIYSEYFRLIKKAIKSKLFDVMSHLDIYQRVVRRLPFEEMKETWEEVADLLLENDVGFEINTSNKLNGIEGIYPEYDVVKLFVEKGIRKITIGSDAHSTERIGERIDDVEKMLKELGVKEVCIFEKRLPKFIPLGD